MHTEWRDAATRVIWISLGGVLGANARYWLGGWVQQRWGTAFPGGTLLINLSGSFLLGLLMALVTERYVTFYTPTLRLAVGIGFLGAYTTFSTFTYETLMQVETGAWSGALLNLLASVGGGLLAVWLGLRLGRLL
jgi:fluoride exporter